MAVSLYHGVSFWLLLSFKFVSACPNGECREMAFPAYFFFADKRLVRHSIRSVQVPDMDVCELLCYHEPNCVSINFQNKANDAGKFQCELNNSTHQEHDGEFVKATGYFYHGAENACGNAGPCKHGGTCQSGFTNKRYRCLCSSGFTGDHCEEDVDECKQGTHDCFSEHAQCFNNIGSFGCVCNHGYVGDGKKNCTEAKECRDFQNLTDADRKPSVDVKNPKNDSSLGPGWFRFQGEAGTRMASVCPPEETCNTSAPGWLNGLHPTVDDGIVTRNVCFHHNEDCCLWSTQIEVRNCSSYFVYYLHSTPYTGGSLRYCSSD